MTALSIVRWPLRLPVHIKAVTNPGATQSLGSRVLCVRMYTTYMPNKTISIPEDVLPIIDRLGVPFSSWIADQLRRYDATQTELSMGQQLLADAAMAGVVRPSADESLAVVQRMDRSAPW